MVLLEFCNVALALASLNLFLASSDFCCLLITFANSLDQDQDQQNVGPDLGPNRFTLYTTDRIF